MVQKIHKTVKGAEANYWTRARALKKLQVSLADFRRLCILKGVYPRVPNRAYKGAEKTYYHVKDIKYLNQGGLLEKFRQHKVIAKRIRKALGKANPQKARSIAEREEKLDLSRIILERYPSFILSLRDLDDALSCLALFANQPVAQDANISGERINECRELMDQWNVITAELGVVTKAFASVKGYYYEATVFGEKIVWLVPHEFSVDQGEEADLRVMSTFLELYTNLVKFTLFKLYNLAGYQYPPDRINSGNRAWGRWMNLKLRKLPVAEEEEEKEADPSVPTLQPEDELSLKRRKLFKEQIFYVSRETPVSHMVYCLKAAGAKMVGFDEPIQEDWPPLSPLKASDAKITHHVVDRPEVSMKSLMSQVPCDTRSFIQPQWLLDSFNVAALLPTSPYEPGRTPPPHLSPFIDDESEGYVPDQRRILDAWAGRGGTLTVSDSVNNVTLDEEQLDHDQVAEIVKAHELSKEREAKPEEESTAESDPTPEMPLVAKIESIAKTKVMKGEKLDRVRGKVAMSRHKRNQYENVVRHEERQAAEVAKLEKRKAELKKKK